MAPLVRFFVILTFAIMFRLGTGRMIYRDNVLSKSDYPNARQYDAMDASQREDKRQEQFDLNSEECDGQNYNIKCAPPVPPIGDNFIGNDPPTKAYSKKTVDTQPRLIQKLDPRRESFAEMILNKPMVIIWPVYKN